MKEKHVITDPKGNIVFEGMFESKSDCIDSYCGGNKIMWRGMPRDGYRCKKLNN